MDIKCLIRYSHLKYFEAMTRTLALTTGPSSGIGAACACLLADASDVVLMARRVYRLQDLADELRKACAAVEALPADLSTREDIVTVRDRSSAGAVRLLIDNVGVGGSVPLRSSTSIRPRPMARSLSTLRRRDNSPASHSPACSPPKTAPSPRCPLPAPDGPRSTLYIAARPPRLPSLGYAPRCSAPARWPPSFTRAWDKPSRSMPPPAWSCPATLAPLARTGVQHR